MGSKSSKGSCSNSSYSSRSREGSDVEILDEKDDRILKIEYVYDYHNKNSYGLILETEGFFYSVKYNSSKKDLCSKRTKKFSEAKDFIDKNGNFFYGNLEFDSNIKLGEFGEIIDDLNGCGNDDEFIEQIKEKIKKSNGMKYSNYSPSICKEGFEKILSVTKVVIPYKGRAGVKAARAVGRIFTFNLINLSESVRQDLEHWGLIFETEHYYHVVQYCDKGIKTMKSTSWKDCKESIYNLALNPYDTWTEKVSFRSGLDLSDVQRYTRDLIPLFNENNYNAFTNNCQYFVKAFLKKIS